MENKEECFNCNFYDDDNCKRNSPTMNSDSPWGIFPKVSGDDWCGEWKTLTSVCLKRIND